MIKFNMTKVSVFSLFAAVVAVVIDSYVYAQQAPPTKVMTEAQILQQQPSQEPVKQEQQGTQAQAKKEEGYYSQAVHIK